MSMSCTFPVLCEQQSMTNSSSEGDCSKLVGDSDSEGFAVTVVSSGLYNVLKCLYICVTTVHQSNWRQLKKYL